MIVKHVHKCILVFTCSPYFIVEVCEKLTTSLPFDFSLWKIYNLHFFSGNKKK